MEASVFKDLHNSRYLKMLSKLHEPLGVYYMTEKIANLRALSIAVY